MSEQVNNEKGFLNEKLGDFRVNPPEKVWNSISAQLGGSSSRRMIILLLASAASIALAVTLGINFFGPELPEETGSAGTDENRSMNQEEHEPSYAAQPDQINESASGDEASSQARQVPSEPDIARLTEEEVLPVEEAIADIVQFRAEEGIIEIERNPDEEREAGIKEDTRVANDMGIAENVRVADDEGIAGNEQIPVDETIAKNDGISDEKEAPDVGDPTEIMADLNQDLTQQTSTDPRWIVGAALSPLYSFRDAETSAMASASEFESGLLSYAGGLHVSYRTASRLAIESGIYFNKMGISIGAPGIQLFNQSFDFSPLAEEAYSANVTTVTNSVGNIVARSGEVYVNNYKLNAANENNALLDNSSLNAVPADQGIRQHLDYLELPFNLRYTVIDRGIELQLVGGMSTNFLVNNYVTMETYTGTTEIGYLTNIRSVNYSGNAGIGMIYHLGEQISIRMEPRFRYFLNSVNDKTLPSTRPYTFGLFTGMNFTF